MRRQLEENKDQDASLTVRRQRVESSPQPCLENVRLDGLLFISKINHRNRSFIPSTKNYFGGICVKKVLCDTGCSTILLPLEENQLSEFFSSFPASDYIISVGDSDNAGGNTPVLKVCKIHNAPFDVYILKSITLQCVNKILSLRTK